jgi:hypothetical protein
MACPLIFFRFTDCNSSISERLDEHLLKPLSNHEVKRSEEIIIYADAWISHRH